MKEQLISFETTKLAKEKGFLKEWCELAYRKEDGNLYGDTGDYTDYPAPTQSLLQKWLRDEHRINIYIALCGSGEDSWYWSLNDDVYQQGGSGFEESLEEGLKKGLELL